MDMDKREYVVHREVLDDARLDEVAQKGTWSTQLTIAERAKESFRCSVSRLKLMVLSWVPVLSWLPHYPIKENIMGDLISGCSVAIMHLSQGLAYAPLAGLRPVFGLYTSFYPVLIYFIFGTSRHISIGTFAVVSMMVGSVVERLAPDANFIGNGTNGTNVNTDARDAYRVQITSSLAVLTGIFQILLGVVKFGFVVNYLSEPLVRAYTTGSAFLVCISQLKYIFGVTPSQFSGPLSVIYTLVDICQLLPKTKVQELLVSVVALTILIAIKGISAYYRQKLPLPIPVELFLIVAATLATHFGDLNSKYDIGVIGEIPTRLEAPSAPDATLFTQLIGDAFAVAVVSYTTSISLAKTFALKHGYKVENNQELLALGLSNTVGGFFQCYSVTACLSRTLVQESTGGKTQVAGIFSSIILLIAILQIGSFFEDLPVAVLATIVVVNLKGMFEQFVDLPMLWTTNKVDLLIWLVTFISTILLNLDLGLAVSVGFAIITLILRIQRPHYSILGLLSGTDLYLDIETYKEAKEIPGIKIFRSSASINYTNAEMYVDALQEKSGIDFGKLLSAHKKQEAELKQKQDIEKNKAEKEAKNQVFGQVSSGIFTLNEITEEKRGLTRQIRDIVSDFSLTERFPSGLGTGRVNWAFQHDPTISNSDSDMGCHGDDGINQTLSDGDEEQGRVFRQGTHSIILDMSTTSFVDTVTVNTLKNIFLDLGQINLDIYLAGCQVCVVKQLETAGFFSEFIPKSKLFVTVHDAVLHVRKKHNQTDLKPDDSNITKM
ncbi:solute carrier family 26 member 6-like [Anabas testudineus]|uniref:solute carrier family 26 member 6-like n=1 Tax=Anabas testudineus TaxID=64144 RepID=UPI000E4604A1|nr:solute carrier family 26 member 6-like [Anabas testudineus]